MTESSKIDFRPRWARSNPYARADLGEMPLIGLLPETPPNLVTRILPRNERNTLLFKSVGDVLWTTQQIMNFAAWEECYGINPDYSDLRSAPVEVLRLAELHSKPSEEGSFIVPAELGDRSEKIVADGTERVVTTRDVLRRFQELMSALELPKVSVSVSIGAMQAVEDLGKILRREASRIEYRSLLFPSESNDVQPIVVDREFVSRVAAVRVKRQTTRSISQHLTGMLVAVDLSRPGLKLRLESGRTISGHFSELIGYTLARSLGLKVRLSGDVVFKPGKKHPSSIHAFSIETLEDPSE